MTENSTDTTPSTESALARLRRIVADTTMPFVLDGTGTDTIYAARDGKYEMPIESGYRAVGTTDGGGVVFARPIDDDTIGVPIPSPDPFTVAAWHMHAGLWTLPDNYDPYAGRADFFKGMNEAFEKFGESVEHATGMLQQIAGTWPTPEEPDDPHDARRKPGEVPKPKRTPPMWADVPGNKRGRNQRRRTRIR